MFKEKRKGGEVMVTITRAEAARRLASSKVAYAFSGLWELFAKYMADRFDHVPKAGEADPMSVEQFVEACFVGVAALRSGNYYCVHPALVRLSDSQEVGLERGIGHITADLFCADVHREAVKAWGQLFHPELRAESQRGRRAA